MNKTKDVYSRIPNGFFYNDSLIKNVGKNALMVYDALYIRKGLDNIVSVSLEYLVEYCGYKPNRNKGKSNDIIKDAIYKLEDSGYIKIIDKEKMLPKNLILLTLESDLDRNYTMLKRSEIEKILSTKSKMDKHNLLNVYMYLKSRMHKKQKGKSMEVHGGLPETCFPTHDKIIEDLGVSKHSISKIIVELDKLNLIRYDNCGNWYDKKKEKWNASSNIYTLYTEHEEIYKNRLKEAKKNYKKYYKSLGLEFENN